MPPITIVLSTFIQHRLVKAEETVRLPGAVTGGYGVRFDLEMECVYRYDAE
jgi:hypothetical protein